MSDAIKSKSGMDSKKNGASSKYNNIDIGDIRRKQIIESVRSIIVRSGLESVTIANIAEELGTSRGVIVYHFENKEDMLHEVLKSAMHDANEIALKFERKFIDTPDVSTMISQVVRLAKSSNDWWKIYFSYLSQAHVNKIYQNQLSWSDESYRRALTSILGDRSKATIVLALMKGLAIQASVNPELEISSIAGELEKLMWHWLGDSPAENAS